MEHMTETVYRVSEERARCSVGYEVMFVLNGLLHKGIVLEVNGNELFKRYLPFIATIRITDGLNKMVAIETADIVWIKKSRWHSRLEKLYREGTEVLVYDKDVNI